MFFATKILCYFCLLVSNVGASSMEIRLVSNFPIEFAGMFRTKGLTCQRYPKLYLVIVDDNVNLLHVLGLCDLWKDDVNAHSSACSSSVRSVEG
jgi:hypothetical protein